MKRLTFLLVIIIAFLGLAINEAYALPRVIVQKGCDVMKVFSGNNTKYVIRDDIDLEGKVINIGIDCYISFKGGSFSNGSLVGNHTKLNVTKKNVFHNCEILGSWDLEISYSGMFDDSVDAIYLLKNLSTLSPNVRLSGNRTYDIDAKGEQIKVSSISAESQIKPLISFHTTNPNVSGLTIIGDNVELKGLRLNDDYNKNNDVKYGKNNPLIGNTITVLSDHQEVQTLNINGCDFSGSTSSSFVASSQVKNCIIKNCSFTGYYADHGVYCSVKPDTFVVESCVANDVSYASGLFKVRSSKHLRLFVIRNTRLHNFNGYLANISLLNTPDALLSFNRISVSKDLLSDAVFYGFCISDETGNMEGQGYNANTISFSNCKFDYGYSNSPLVYPGSANKVCVRESKYYRIYANGSNFCGGYCDLLNVSDCVFENFYGEKGTPICCHCMNIRNTVLKDYSVSEKQCVFLINHEGNFLTNRISMKNVYVDIKANYLYYIVQGNQLHFSLSGGQINSHLEIFKGPLFFKIN